MRLAVENLPPAGRTIAFSAADGWAREAARAALEAEPSALSGSIEVQRAVDRLEAEEMRLSGRPPAGLVEVVVHARAAAERPCDRCAEPVVLSLTVETPLSYLPLVPTEPPAGSEGEEEEELVEDEDLDIGWYNDGELDLDAVLREALALALPPRVVCEDKRACDTRTEALLRAAAPADDGPSARKASPFGALGKLAISAPKSRSN